MGVGAALWRRLSCLWPRSFIAFAAPGELAFGPRTMGILRWFGIWIAGLSYLGFRRRPAIFKIAVLGTFHRRFVVGIVVMEIPRIAGRLENCVHAVDDGTRRTG